MSIQNKQEKQERNLTTVCCEIASKVLSDPNFINLCSDLNNWRFSIITVDSSIRFQLSWEIDNTPTGVNYYLSQTEMEQIICDELILPQIIIDYFQSRV